MVYFVYILYSSKDQGLYVGCTRNLEQRLRIHNRGGVPSTKSRRPLKLIYTELFSSKVQAFQRERFLKSLWSAKLKRKILKNYLDKVNHTLS